MIKVIHNPFDRILDGFYYFRPCNSTGKDDLAEIRTVVNDPVRGEQIGFVKWYNMPEELQKRYHRDIESYERMSRAVASGANRRKRIRKDTI